MVLTASHIATYKTLMTQPKEHGLDFPSISEIFEKAEEPTAKHLLYEQYLAKINKGQEQMPKIFFYIVMDELYEQGKDKNGYIGYCVRIVNSSIVWRWDDDVWEGKINETHYFAVEPNNEGATVYQMKKPVGNMLDFPSVESAKEHCEKVLAKQYLQ